MWIETNYRNHCLHSTEDEALAVIMALELQCRIQGSNSAKIMPVRRGKNPACRNKVWQQGLISENNICQEHQKEMPLSLLNNRKKC